LGPIALRVDGAVGGHGLGSGSVGFDEQPKFGFDAVYFVRGDEQQEIEEKEGGRDGFDGIFRQVVAGQSGCSGGGCDRNDDGIYSFEVIEVKIEEGGCGRDSSCRSGEQHDGCARSQTSVGGSREQHHGSAGDETGFRARGEFLRRHDGRSGQAGE